jgi:hypothetical protein
MIELLEIGLTVFFSFLFGTLFAMAIYDSVKKWLEKIFK